jgi:hypothetical protein
MNSTPRHPATEHLLSLFDHGHLPDHLRKVAAPLAVLAYQMADTLGSGPELTSGLRKLLEAKDCLVRQAVIDHRTAEADK